MTTKAIAVTLICVGVFCLIFAFALCLCKTAKNSDEQYQITYKEGIYNDRPQRK